MEVSTSKAHMYHKPHIMKHKLMIFQLSRYFGWMFYLVFEAQYDLNTHQFDVKIAMLNDDLDKPISMAVPKDLEKPSQSTNCFQIIKQSTWIMPDPLEHGTNAFTHFALYRFSKTAFESSIYFKT